MMIQSRHRHKTDTCCCKETLEKLYSEPRANLSPELNPDTSQGTVQKFVAQRDLLPVRRVLTCTHLRDCLDSIESF